MMSYSKQTYQAAMRELDTRRSGAEQDAARRRANAYARLPALAELERRLSQTGLEAVRAAVLGDGDPAARIKRLRTENLQIQQQRTELLTQAGLPADHLEVRYSCPKCQDTGYIAQQRCSCLDTLLRRIAYQMVSESSGLDECRFENFDLGFYSDQSSGQKPSDRRVMEQIFQTCRSYAADFSRSSESLLFFGNTGLGKTHLSLSIAYEVIQRGYGVYYTSCQRLMDKLQARQFQKNLTDSTDYLALALECDLLIIDDLGAEFTTTFTTATIQNLVNARMTDHRPTIASTNYDVALLSERYGERLVSRLFCAYRAYPFQGQDIRKLKRFST